MQNKLVSWVHGKAAKLRGKKGKGKQCEDGPKELRPPWESRSCALTPTTSRTDLGTLASPVPPDSAFFKKLPAEVRRKILIAAFGDGTVHMSLEYNHPRHLVFDTSPGLSSPWQRYMPRDAKYPPQLLRPDPQEPKRWNWRGCPCWHAGTPQYLHMDRCLPGVARCWKPGRPVLDACLMGSMGWLLTCRQAYAEGIEVLYSTNTFRLSNRNSVILHHLQSLLPLHRLSMITSIDVSLAIYDVMHEPEGADEIAPSQPDSTRPGFLALLDAIPRSFPRLRTVVLDLHGHLFPGLRLQERPPLYDQFLFEPVDSVVRNLGPELQQFTLVIPFTIMQKVTKRAVAQGAEFKCHGWDAIFWRPVAPITNGQEGTTEETSGNKEGETRGYWITKGHFDDPYPPMGCFGTGSMDPDAHDAINAELDSWTEKDEPRRVEV